MHDAFANVVNSTCAVKRNDSLNEFIMNKDKEKKEAMAAAASAPTTNPFKLSSGQKNTGSSYAQKCTPSVARMRSYDHVLPVSYTHLTLPTNRAV